MKNRGVKWEEDSKIPACHNVLQQQPARWFQCEKTAHQIFQGSLRVFLLLLPKLKEEE